MVCHFVLKMYWWTSRDLAQLICIKGADIPGRRENSHTGIMVDELLQIMIGQSGDGKDPEEMASDCGEVDCWGLARNPKKREVQGAPVKPYWARDWGWIGVVIGRCWCRQSVRCCAVQHLAMIDCAGMLPSCRICAAGVVSWITVVCRD